ncbi:hypothetical protein ACQ4PT_020468 [Festuca glaucescens]
MDMPPVVVFKPSAASVHVAPAPSPPEVVIVVGLVVEVCGGGRVDMALRLMVLAHGARSEPSSLLAVAKDAVVAGKEEGKFRSRHPVDAGAGEYVNQCTTCGRCFPSFQALGGHRTSHKKLHLLPTPDGDTRPTPPVPKENTLTPRSPAADPMVLVIPATPPKHEAVMATAIGGSKQQQQQGRLHECGVCGPEFASGQALVSHMRRHRPLLPASHTNLGVVASSEKGKSLLELDLNMPAPCDDAAETTSFRAKKMSSVAPATILLPALAPALVDCRC